MAKRLSGYALVAAGPFFEYYRPRRRQEKPMTTMKRFLNEQRREAELAKERLARIRGKA